MESKDDKSKKRKRHNGDVTDEKVERKHRRVEGSKKPMSQSGENLDIQAERTRKNTG